MKKFFIFLLIFFSLLLTSCSSPKTVDNNSGTSGSRIEITSSNYRDYVSILGSKHPQSNNHPVGLANFTATLRNRDLYSDWDIYIEIQDNISFSIQYRSPGDSVIAAETSTSFVYVQYVSGYVVKK